MNKTMFLQLLTIMCVVMNAVTASPELDLDIHSPVQYSEFDKVARSPEFMDSLSENERRLLAEEKPIKDCNDYRMRVNCYFCMGISQGKCYWDRGVCKTNKEIKRYDPSDWFKYYEKCPDTQNKRLCQQSKTNSTFFTYKLSYQLWNDKTPATLAARKKLYLPQQYFCKWTHIIDPSLDIEWKIYIQRLHSIKATETVQFRLYFGQDKTRGYIMSDKLLRAKSFIYADNTKQGLMKYTSHANVPIKEGITMIDIYARNNLKMQPNSFLIEIKEMKRTTSWITVFFSAITGIIFVLLMLVCASRCYRDCAGSGMPSGSINWEVELVNPNWDADQVRIYNIRRLQRQLEEQNADIDGSDGEPDEDERAERDRLRQEIQQLEMQNAMEFINSIENITFDNGAMQYDIRDCIICMDPLEQGEAVQRIPGCKHCFHPDCLRKWFTSKTQEDEQRCPQCNQVLKSFEMKAAKEKNEQEQFISPASRGMGIENSIAPSDVGMDGQTYQADSGTKYQQ